MKRAYGAIGVFLFFGASLLSQEPGVEAQQAEKALVAGNSAEAIRLYIRLQATYPHNLGVTRNLGLAYHTAGRYREALTCFESVLQRSPDDKAALLFSGVELNALQQPAKAIETLNRYMEQDANTPVALLARGGSYLSLGRYDLAIQDFSKASALEPQNAKAWEGMSKASLLAAQAAFEQVELHGRFSPEWYALLARSYLSSQNYKTAYQFFRAAESKDPKLPGVHAGLAEVYSKTDHPDWARTESAKEQDANQQAATDLRREYLSALGFQQRAMKALTTLARHADTAEYHELMGLSYRVQRRDTESVHEFRHALELAPESPSLKLELATSLVVSKDCDAAIPLLRTALHDQPDSAEASHLMGECLIDQNHPEQAVPFLQTALKKDSRLLPAEAALGRAYLHSGNFAAAKTHLQRAVSLGDPEILYQLAEACRKAGQAASADEYLAQYRSRKAQIQESTRDTDGEIGPP